MVRAEEGIGVLGQRDTLSRESLVSLVAATAREATDGAFGAVA
jgi:hypothetical protein